MAKKSNNSVFQSAKTKEEAEQLREKMVKFTDKSTGPNGIDACIVDVNFDNKKKCITGATVRHYDHAENKWHEGTIDVGESDLSKYN